MHNSFGLQDLRAEGMPAHPDIYINASQMSDEWYRRQLEAYVAWSNHTDAFKTCVRNRLWEILE
mgnify:FL=1